MTGQSSGAGGGYPALTEAHSLLAVDVTPSIINTWTDVLSVSITAGTWLLTGKGNYAWASVASTIAFRLFDGTTEYDLSEGVVSSGANLVSIPLLAVLTFAVTTTVKMQVSAAVLGGRVLGTHALIGSDGHSTRLHALRYQ